MIPQIPVHDQQVRALAQTVVSVPEGEGVGVLRRHQDRPGRRLLQDPVGPLHRRPVAVQVHLPPEEQCLGQREEQEGPRGVPSVPRQVFCRLCQPHPQPEGRQRHGRDQVDQRVGGVVTDGVEAETAEGQGGGESKRAMFPPDNPPSPEGQERAGRGELAGQQASPGQEPLRPEGGGQGEEVTVVEATADVLPPACRGGEVGPGGGGGPEGQEDGAVEEGGSKKQGGKKQEGRRQEVEAGSRRARGGNRDLPKYQGGQEEEGRVDADAQPPHNAQEPGRGAAKGQEEDGSGEESGRGVDFGDEGLGPEEGGEAEGEGADCRVLIADCGLRIAEC